MSPRLKKTEREEKLNTVTLDELAKKRDGLPRLPKSIWDCWKSINDIRGAISLQDDGNNLIFEGRLKIPKRAILGAFILGYVLTNGQFVQKLVNIF